MALSEDDKQARLNEALVEFVRGSKDNSVVQKAKILLGALRQEALTEQAIQRFQRNQFLDTEEGQEFLDTEEGQKFLGTAEGRKFLVTPRGLDFLMQHRAGTTFAGSSEGKVFVALPEVQTALTTIERLSNSAFLEASTEALKGVRSDAGKAAAKAVDDAKNKVAAAEGALAGPLTLEAEDPEAKTAAEAVDDAKNKVAAALTPEAKEKLDKHFKERKAAKLTDLKKALTTRNQDALGSTIEADQPEVSQVDLDNLKALAEGAENAALAAAMALPTASLPQDLVVFIGILSDSPKGPAYQRLYLTIQLNDYIEFPVNKLVSVLDAFGTTMQVQLIWLQRDAQVEHVFMETVDLHRGFLQGNIAGGFGSYGGGSISAHGGGSAFCGGGTGWCGGGSGTPQGCGGTGLWCGGGSGTPQGCGGTGLWCGGG
jgi:hypothetical protein